MTFLEMQTDALDLLQEIQDHPQYSLTKLKGYINRGNLTFVRKTKSVEGTVDITTVANQFEYDSSDAATLSSVMIPFQVFLKPYRPGPPRTPMKNVSRASGHSWPHFQNVRPHVNIAPCAIMPDRLSSGLRAGTCLSAWPPFPPIQLPNRHGHP